MHSTAAFMQVRHSSGTARNSGNCSSRTDHVNRRPSTKATTGWSHSTAPPADDNPTALALRQSVAGSDFHTTRLNRPVLRRRPAIPRSAIPHCRDPLYIDRKKSSFPSLIFYISLLFLVKTEFSVERKPFIQ